MIDQEFQRLVPHEKFTSLHRCILAGLITDQVTKAKSLLLSCAEKLVLSHLLMLVLVVTLIDCTLWLEFRDRMPRKSCAGL